MAAALAAAALACGAAAPARAQGNASKQLERIERALEQGRDRQRGLERKAQELRHQVANLRRGLIDAAASAQRQEEAVSSLERRLAGLRAEEDAKSADLARRRAELAATLGALQRLSLQPPETLIASPGSGIDMLRSSLLLGAVVPSLEAQARTLRRDLTALAALRGEITSRRAELAAADGVLAKERRALDRLLKRKAGLQARAEAESTREGDRLTRMAEEADSLRALIVRLEVERQAREQAPPPAPAPGAIALTPPAPLELRPAPPAQPFSATRGTLALPARGRIIRRFGERGEYDLPAKGITIATRPWAQVIAPYDGRVAFAGPFRGYGQLLIIEHGEGYHTLVAGLSRIDGEVGQWLLAGEPIGQMGDGEGGRPSLYVELRRNGEPINPLPWLAASETEVSG
ncbi:MAG: peptidoglycan DD-metalloendopeptidase family protein [Alphaproteobacteria bacterium]